MRARLKEEDIINAAMIAVLVLTGFSACIWSILQLIGPGAGAPNSGTPDSAAPDTVFGQGFRGVVISWALAAFSAIPLMIVAERLLPLRSMDEADWVYKYRRKGKLPTFGGLAALQVSAFFLIGSVLGAAAQGTWGAVAFAALLLALLRVVWGFHRAGSPHSLLQQGLSVTSLGVSSYALDSDLASDLATLSWMRGRKHRSYRTWDPFVLSVVVARIRRRNFSLLLLLAILAASCLLLPSFGSALYVLVVVAISLVLSSILSSCSFHKFPDFNQLAELRIVRIIVGLLVAYVSTGFLYLISDGAMNPWFGPFIGLFMFWAGLQRARPRKYTTFTLIDAGMGMMIPQELLMYWVAGWPSLVGASLTTIWAFAY